MAIDELILIGLGYGYLIKSRCSYRVSNTSANSLHAVKAKRSFPQDDVPMQLNDK